MTDAFDHKLWQLIHEEVMVAHSMTWDEVFNALVTTASMIIMNDPEYNKGSAKEYSERARYMVQNGGERPEMIRTTTMGEIVESTIERMLEQLPEHVRATWEQMEREDVGSTKGT